MELRREDAGEITVIRMEGERLDAVIAVEFKERFRKLSKTARPRVVLDMTGITFMDSSGLGAVVAVYKLLGQQHQFDLTGLSPAVDRVFRLTRMDSIFNIYPALTDALSAEGAADAQQAAS
jgi:anti-sigma B factor antagonist